MYLRPLRHPTFLHICNSIPGLPWVIQSRLEVTHRNPTGPWHLPCIEIWSGSSNCSTNNNNNSSSINLREVHSPCSINPFRRGQHPQIWLRQVSHYARFDRKIYPRCGLETPREKFDWPDLKIIHHSQWPIPRDIHRLRQ